MIKTILLVIVALAVLSYFGINIRSIVESDIFQTNFNYLKNLFLKLWNWIVSVWERFLARPARYLWNDIFLNLIWEPFVSNMRRIKDGGSGGLIDTPTPKVVF